MTAKQFNWEENHDRRTRRGFGSGSARRPPPGRESDARSRSSKNNGMAARNPCTLSAFSATRKSSHSTRSNGSGAPPKSPTTPARSFSSRKMSRCPSRGRCWPRRWSSRNIFTASRTRPSAKPRCASSSTASAARLRIGASRTVISARRTARFFTRN